MPPKPVSETPEFPQVHDAPETPAVSDAAPDKGEETVPMARFRGLSSYAEKLRRQYDDLNSKYNAIIEEYEGYRTGFENEKQALTAKLSEMEAALQQARAQAERAARKEALLSQIAVQHSDLLPWADEIATLALTADSPEKQAEIITRFKEKLESHSGRRAPASPPPPPTTVTQTAQPANLNEAAEIMSQALLSHGVASPEYQRARDAYLALLRS